ncbi:MAG: type II secretion system protein [bacterium]|nr:type II secretion system protein [bacterium]
MAGNLTLLIRNRERGYTITELLVVVAIIVLMTSLVLPNWRSGERGLAMERTASKLGQDVRRVQEFAMRAQAYTCATGSISGYGIHFDTSAPDSYILFAECNDTNTYDSGVDGIVEVADMESGVKMQEILLDSVPGGTASIVFIPPAPTVFIKPGDPLEARIVLERTDGVTGTRSVTISSKGVIDID